MLLHMEQRVEHPEAVLFVRGEGFFDGGEAGGGLRQAGGAAREPRNLMAREDLPLDGGETGEQELIDLRGDDEHPVVVDESAAHSAGVELREPLVQQEVLEELRERDRHVAFEAAAADGERARDVLEVGRGA